LISLSCRSNKTLYKNHHEPELTFKVRKLRYEKEKENQYLKANIIGENDIFTNFNFLRSFRIVHKLAIMRITCAQTSVCIIPFPIKLMLDAVDMYMKYRT
jgi:hypothetical protein